jgi:hypothetical protein
LSSRSEKAMNNTINSSEQMAIEWACEKLGRMYALCSDSNDIDALSQLFTEDGVFVRPTVPDVEIKGRAEIRAAFLKRPPIVVMHQVTNCLVSAVSANVATGISYISFLLAPGTDQPLPRIGGVIHFGEFRDRFVLTADGWKFSERRGRMLLKSA